MENEKNGVTMFEHEINIIHSNDEYKKRKSHGLDELLSRYKNLTWEYEKLFKIAKKIFRISDIYNNEVKRREFELKMLLDNSNQGFLTFGKDLLVRKEYSIECVRIFEKQINHIHILDLIAKDDRYLYDFLIEHFCGFFNSSKEDIKRFHMEKLPQTIGLSGKIIKIEYKGIANGYHEEVLMLILTDITEKMKAEEQILYLTFHDQLTSLYNRTYVDEIISKIQAPINLPLGLIVGDMNGLKLVNDIFGHKEGDRLLVGIANVLKGCVRKDDIIVRWGGDEFVILLPMSDAHSCRMLCERIKRVCRDLIWDPIELSISLGYAIQTDPSMSFSELFSTADVMMYTNKEHESSDVKKRILLSMGKILEDRCYESLEHSKRIESLALKLIKKSGIEDPSLSDESVSLLADLHDIGKITMGRKLLSKSEKLTKEEWEKLKSHSEIGFKMLQSIHEPALAYALLSIHEHWDGSGYPQGLKGDKIPVLARVISIVEAFDVMTHDRPYRRAMVLEKAVEEIRNCIGRQFDPILGKHFIEMINNK